MANVFSSATSAKKSVNDDSYVHYGFRMNKSGSKSDVRTRISVVHSWLLVVTICS